MATFFRKFRHHLLSEGKIGKYLQYALGEIILVVIGILIALQINNWNIDSGNRKAETAIIQNLNLEFRQNKVTLQECIAHQQAILSSTKDVMNLIGETASVLNHYNLDSLISQSLDYTIYNPSQAVYSDLISSGKLDLISSDSLRLLLFEWSRNLGQITEAYQTLDEITQTLILAYLTKHASMKNIDNYSFVRWKAKSKLHTNYHRMFQDLEFENNMDNQIWNLLNYLNSLESLDKTINRVIEATGRER